MSFLSDHVACHHGGRGTARLSAITLVSGCISRAAPHDHSIGSVDKKRKDRSENPMRGTRAQPMVEQMIHAANQLSALRSRLLTTLLSAANPTRVGGHDVLRPLWANEAMHRAYNLVLLTRALDVRAPSGRAGSVVETLEERNAAALAKAYAALDITRDEEVVPCSEILRTILTNLVELYGPAMGDITIQMRISPLSLPAFKRRALILACNELAINSLRHAFQCGSVGSIEVVLEEVEQNRIRLVVVDDGRVQKPVLDTTRLGAAVDLALLLEGTLSYHQSSQGGTSAEIDFAK